jgi:hypothetical protein
VRKIEGRSAAMGRLTGEFHWGRVLARVPSERRRDTERNHTATHLLHAALRNTLGDAVHQAGSLVAPDRLRFDFTHHGPVPSEKLAEVEAIVNREIWRARPVVWTEMPYAEARARGAMALFGEKYGDVVRVVDVPEVSMELCGGTHVRNTSEIGLFRILAETGVASGVRRIEALTGPGAFAMMRERERVLARVAESLRTPADAVERRVQQLADERRALEKKLEEAMRGGGDELQKLIAAATPLGGNGARLVMGEVRVDDAKSLQGARRCAPRAAVQRRRPARRPAERREGLAARGRDGRPACEGIACGRDRARRGRAGRWPGRRQAPHGAGRYSRCGSHASRAERGAEARGGTARERMILARWLDSRRPLPPAALRSRIDAALGLISSPTWTTSRTRCSRRASGWRARCSPRTRRRGVGARSPRRGRAGHVCVRGGERSAHRADEPRRGGDGAHRRTGRRARATRSLVTTGAR